jgi:hypothetical protein
MTQVSPSFSTLDTDRHVYHNNDRCEEFNCIDESNLIRGHLGGRPLCERCEQLDDEEAKELLDSKA